MSTIWILKAGDGDKAWIEAVFADKTKAEAALRYMKETDDGRGFLYWIKEHEVTQ